MGYIDRFTALAVYGRALAPHEMRRLTTAENVFLLATVQLSQEQPVSWNQQHPKEAKLLRWSADVAHEMGLIETDD